jgi:hypothetical protein
LSSDGSITLTWADGDHVFRTRLGEWREIQDKCGAGLIEIMDRLQGRRWRVDDIREPIRIGLIGGGLTPTHALGLVKRYVDDRPIAESLPIALAILMAAIVGVPEDPPDGDRSKKKDEPTDGTSGTDDSSSLPSMDPVPSSDLPRAKSTA